MSARSPLRRTDILLSAACPVFRSQAPNSSATLISRTAQIIEESDAEISNATASLQHSLMITRRLDSAAKSVDENVQALSSFEALQAISQKQYSNTQCIICLGHLGSGGNCFDESQCKLCDPLRSENHDERSMITMTKCVSFGCK